MRPLTIGASLGYQRERDAMMCVASGATSISGSGIGRVQRSRRISNFDHCRQICAAEYAARCSCATSTYGRQLRSSPPRACSGCSACSCASSALVGGMYSACPSRNRDMRACATAEPPDRGDSGEGGDGFDIDALARQLSAEAGRMRAEVRLPD